MLAYLETFNTGITFEEDVRGVNAILITMPEGITHAVKDPSDMKNLNKFFPVAPAGTWVDYSNPKTLTVSSML